MSRRSRGFDSRRGHTTTRHKVAELKSGVLVRLTRALPMCSPFGSVYVARFPAAPLIRLVPKAHLTGATSARLSSRCPYSRPGHNVARERVGEFRGDSASRFN